MVRGAKTHNKLPVWQNLRDDSGNRRRSESAGGDKAGIEPRETKVGCDSYVHGREDMKKSVAWILGAITIASLLPGMGISHADTQCAADAEQYSYPGGVSDPRNGLGYGTRVMRIRSGAALLPTYPTVPESGLNDLGFIGCENTITSTVANTNILTPGSTVLQVVAVNTPNDLDHLPLGGCLKWNATPPLYPSTCSGTGTVVLKWHWQNSNPVETTPGAYSQVITIPAGVTSVVATASLSVNTSHSTAPNLVRQNMTVKYTAAA
jgi:hypothetical protein